MDPSAVAGILVGSAVVSAFVTAILGHWNELSRAREERRQKRLADTYLTVVGFVIAASDWVDRIHPVLERAVDAPFPVIPVIPGAEEQRAIRARLSAFGSTEMQSAYREHIRAVNDFIKVAQDLDSALAEVKVHPDRPGLDDEWAAARSAVTDIREERVHPLGEALLKIANDELAERGFWKRWRRRLIRFAAWVGRQVRRPDRWVRAHVRRGSQSSETGVFQ